MARAGSDVDIKTECGTQTKQTQSSLSQTPLVNVSVVYYSEARTYGASCFWGFLFVYIILTANTYYLPVSKDGSKSFVWACAEKSSLLKGRIWYTVQED